MASSPESKLLANGVWRSLDNYLTRVELSGTGIVTFDARNTLGDVTLSIDSFPVFGGAPDVKFLNLPEDAVEVRATTTDTAQARII